MGRYLESDDVKPTTVSEAKKLVGKKIQYLQRNDIDRSGRGYIFPRFGVVEEVFRKNLCIDGDYKGFKTFVEIVVMDDAPEDDV